MLVLSVCLSVLTVRPHPDLLDLIEAGHGDVRLSLASSAALRLRCVRTLPELEGVDGGRAGALEAVLSFGGAPAQQGGELQLLCADTGGAP